MKKLRYALFSLLAVLLLIPAKSQAATLDTPQVKLELGSCYIYMEWTSVKGATKYDIYRKINLGSWKLIRADYDGHDGETYSYCDDQNDYNGFEMKSGRTYSYSIVAKNSTDKSIFDNIGKSYVITKVSKIKTSNVTAGIKVKWPTVKGATKLDLYRNNKKIKQLAGDAVSYTDSAVKTKNLKRYYYKIVPYHDAQKGEEDYTECVRLLAPKLISVKSTAKKTLTVKWKKVTGAKSYTVEYWIPGKKAKAVTVKGGSKVSCKLKGLSRGKKYKVKVSVRAYKIYYDESCVGTDNSDPDNPVDIYETVKLYDYDTTSAYSKTMAAKVK